MDVYEELVREKSEGRGCALATIVNAVGSIPSYATAKMLVREDGTIVGTIGGGASEAAVIAEAKEVLASGVVQDDYLRPARKSAHGYRHGLRRQPPRLHRGDPAGPVAYLFGAGHVGALTAQAAKLAGFEVEVIDDRPEFASPERFPDARALHTGDMEAIVGGP